MSDKESLPVGVWWDGFEDQICLQQAEGLHWWFRRHGGSWYYKLHSMVVITHWSSCCEVFL